MAPGATAIDPNRFIFGFNANPGGVLTWGPAVGFELGKGNFNIEVNLVFPFAGAIGAEGGLLRLTAFGTAAPVVFIWAQVSGTWA